MACARTPFGIFGTVGLALAMNATVGGCAASADPSADAVPATALATDTSDTDPASLPLASVPGSRLCVTDGRIDALDARVFQVELGGMRAVIEGDASRTAELAFTYRGPSATDAPLANGELRRQIGLKLRAQDTCNVVYVMWHLAPTPGIAVSVKSNPGRSRHEECGDGGYVNVAPRSGTRPALVEPGAQHTLRAEMIGDTLTVIADGEVAWKGDLPVVTSTLQGPAGIRSDNGTFDFELRVPGGDRRTGTCPAR